jgi:hypothetical protein
MSPPMLRIAATHNERQRVRKYKEMATAVNLFPVSAIDGSTHAHFQLGRSSPRLRNDTSTDTRLAPEPPPNPTPLAHGKGWSQNS